MMLARRGMTCVLCGMVVLAAASGWAATINVSAGQSIQAAIDTASGGDEVVVAAGTYTENLDFGGKAITVRSSDPTNLTVVAATIINGNASGSVVTFQTGETATSVLAGFTITNGTGATTLAGLCGGGIYCASTSPTIINNVITANSANFGGGVECENGSPTISNNIVSGNTVTAGASGASGAGIDCYSDGAVTTPVITSNTIVGNSGTPGAGIYCDNSSPTIKNSIITGNTDGAGIHLASGASPTISYCDVYGNPYADYENLDDQTGTNGNISLDPLFVAVGDYRLQSLGGHWNGTAWVNDAATSPCIDMGDPTSPYANEPTPNGARLNMGFDGNTAYASKTGNTAPTRPTWVTISPSVAGKEDLTATAVGSTDAESNPITYEYQWVKLDPAGGYLTKWVDNPGRVLPASEVEFGDTWQVRARAFDGIAYSAWKPHKTVRIVKMVTFISPAADATDVPLGSSIYITFKWGVDQLSVNRRLRVYQGAALVHGSAQWIKRNEKVRFVPTKPLQPGTDYQVRLASGVECLSGRVLDWSEEYSFQTAGAAGASVVSVAAAPTAVGAQVTVNLSSAATVRTVICNIAGRIVAELPQQDLPAGLTSLLWNGKGNSGTRVPAGTYLVRVQARGADGTQTAALGSLQLR